VMTLSIEEEIYLAAGLLTPNYDPDSELEEGEEHLSPEEQKEDLEGAREEFLSVSGRMSKLSWEDGKWEVGGDVPSSPSLRIRAIFASVRQSRQVLEGEKIIDGLPIAYALGDVRIYAEPKQSLPGDSFKRLTVNRVSPASSHEPLTRENFIEELAAEIRFQLRVECISCSKPIEHDDEVCEFCEADQEGEEPEEEGTPAPAEGLPSTSAEA
jgi:hypothetical protein